MSNIESTPLKKRDDDYTIAYDSPGDHDNYQNSKRDLQRSCLNKYDWTWRFTISMFLTFAMMLVYIIGETIHFNNIRNISSVFNTTARVVQVLVTTESFQRSFFMNRSQIIYETNALEATEFFQARAHEVISLVYEVRIEIFYILIFRIPKFSWINILEIITIHLDNFFISLFVCLSYHAETI